MSWQKLVKFAKKLLFLLIITQLLGTASIPLGDDSVALRKYTSGYEFDYISWTLDAALVKIKQKSLPVQSYLSEPEQKIHVLSYLELVREIQTAEHKLNEIYSDPNIEDKDSEAALVIKELTSLYQERSLSGPIAESIIQSQLATILKEFGFTVGGQPLPPVLYRSTPLPWALIVSPREVIQQDANISLKTELTIDDLIRLEAEIDKGLDVSSLVVPVGGIGSYPTMVAQTTNLTWLVEVVAHEWIHNYLTLRPLGFSYNSSSEVRTMNETVASIAGKEIGLALITRFYLEFLPPPPQPPRENEDNDSPAPPSNPPAFDFRVEMHITRITADEMLAVGNIDEAEEYMEARRKMFWEHGYRIRKLNQAYFAFHGAYADSPGGASGEDPVGAAVRALWAQSGSLLKFVNRMSWLTSFEKLELILE